MTARPGHLLASLSAGVPVLVFVLVFVLVSVLGTASCGRAGSTRDPTRPDTASSCGSRAPLALEVLGSGGPIPDDGRASAGYLLWREGEALGLVDTGGGVFVRFGESGARLESLEFIALTHIHTDHSADLPALLKALYFVGPARGAPLTLVGPSGTDRFPDLHAFLDALIGTTSGAYRYLDWLLAPTADDGAAPLILVEHDATSRTLAALASGEGWELSGVGVAHGPVPALAYRLELAAPSGRPVSVVFAGDQNASNPAFVELARGADVLVMHHAVPEDAGADALGLHAPPSAIGRVAAESGAAQLVLSHHMRRALVQKARGLAEIAARYDGPVVMAQDHTCIPLATR